MSYSATLKSSTLPQISPSDEAISEAKRRQGELLSRLRNDLTNKRLVIAFGADVTLMATADESGSFRKRITWRGLIENGLNYLISERYVNEEDRRIKQALESLDGEELESLVDAERILKSKLVEFGQLETWLQSVYETLPTEVRHPEILDTLKALHDNGATLLTTNYDDVFETYTGVPSVNYSDQSDVQRFKNGSLKGIFHLRGNYRNPTDLMLKTGDYLSMHLSKGVRNILTTFLEYRTILFVGCSMESENMEFSLFLKWIDQQVNVQPNRHCVLVNDSDETRYKTLRRLYYGSNLHDLPVFSNRLLETTADGQTHLGLAHSTVLLKMNDRYTVVDKRSDRLLIEALEDSNVKFTTALTNHTNILIAHQMENEKKNRLHFEKTLEEIRRTFEKDPANLSRSSYVRSQDILAEQERAARRSVLDHLKYRHMTQREESIAQPHAKTFQWVFENPDQADKPWDNLLLWLDKGSGCYWINGKAASGKSTLMKYIYHHNQTRNALAFWAQDSRCLSPAFFFWHAGTPIQRSVEGLLRSILHEALSTYEELIPTVMPGLYNEEIHKWRSTAIIQPLSEVELRMAFMRLLDQISSCSKMCLFIDGIDEYDGNHADISNLFKCVANQESIKVVLSSRPIHECVKAFEDCPGLRLQDLTKDDIRAFVSAELESHPKMQPLLEESPDEAQELVANVTTKSSGVFLWVTIVVRSLLDGLQNYDTVTDLKRRLDALPPELGDLYKHMLSIMKPLYRQQASKLLQIVLRNSEVEQSQPLTLLQLSFANEEDLTVSVRLSDRGLTLEAINKRCDATHGRLLTRCCGLLEVLEGDKTVGFLHKSVIDFLRMEEVRSYLLSLTENTGFDPNVSLMSSLLAMLKQLCQDWQWPEVIDPEEDKQLGPIIGHVKRFLSQCRLAERSHRQAHSLYLNECDRIMQRGWQQVKDVRKIKPCMKGSNHWSVIIAPSNHTKRPWVDSFISLAAYYGLGLYLNERLTTFVQVYGLAPSHLQNVMTAMVDEKDLDTVTDYIRVIAALLRHGSNPNERSSYHLTPWLMSLSIFEDTFTPENQHLFPDLSLILWQLIELFVAHDADLNEILPKGIYGSANMQCIMDQRTVLCVIEQQLSRIERLRQAGTHNLRSRMEQLAGFMKDNGAVNVATLRGKIVRPSRWLLETQVFRPESWESGNENPIFGYTLHNHRASTSNASLWYRSGSGGDTVNACFGNERTNSHLWRPARERTRHSRIYQRYDGGELPLHHPASDSLLSPHFRSEYEQQPKSHLSRTTTLHQDPDSSLSSTSAMKNYGMLSSAQTPRTIFYAPRSDTHEICWHGRIKENCPLGCLDIFNPPPDGE